MKEKEIVMHLKMSLNLVELKQALAFYKQLGFSKQYINNVERNLSAVEQQYAQRLLIGTVQ